MPCTGHCTIQIYEFRPCNLTTVTKFNTDRELKSSELEKAINSIYRYKEKFARSHVGTSVCQDDCECIENEGDPLSITPWQLYSIEKTIKIEINSQPFGGYKHEYEVTGSFEARAKICNGICMPPPLISISIDLLFRIFEKER